MEEEYQTGDFGHAIFRAVKKDFAVDTDCYGTIQMVDKKYVWFNDNNGTPYLIEKKNFKFEKETFVNNLSVQKKASQ